MSARDDLFLDFPWSRQEDADGADEGCHGATRARMILRPTDIAGPLNQAEVRP